MWTRQSSGGRRGLGSEKVLRLLLRRLSSSDYIILKLKYKFKMERYNENDGDHLMKSIEELLAEDKSRLKKKTD